MSSSIYKILSLCFLLPITFAVSAENVKDVKSTKKTEVINIPLYQGVQIGLDFISPLKYFISDTYGASVKADVNLKNKYLPTVEIGFVNFDKTSDAGIHFTSSGEYFKLGINKILSYNGSKAENSFFAGAHYGFSAFTYNLDNLSYYQNYWGNDVTSFSNEKAIVGWIELVAGVRVQVLGPVSLGWTFQYKSTLHVSDGANSIPAYIPGYGQNVKPNAAIAIYLYYKLPF
jgi:hypothetical protein